MSIITLISAAIFGLRATRVPRPPRMVDYAGLDWDGFHRAHSREWLLPYEGPLASAIELRLQGLSKAAPLLELGCGTSDMAKKMYDSGWRNVTSIDCSHAAVRGAQERYGGTRPGLHFATADARTLAGFADASVAAVLDKGTVDAICCGEGFDWEAKQVARQVARVLIPGGRWLCVSLMPPNVLLPLLREGRSEWALVNSEPLSRGLHLYHCHKRGRMFTRWHYHPVEGGWHSRSRAALL